MSMQRTRRNDAGVALIVTLAFLVVMAIIVGYTAARALAHGNQMEQSNDFDQAFIALENAQARAVAEADGFNTVYIGLPNGYRFVDQSGPTPVLNLPDATGADPDIDWQPFNFTSNGSQISYVAMAVDGGADGIDNDDDTIVDEADEVGMFVSYYMASRVMRNGNVVAFRAAEETNLAGENVNVWRNAIFAGIGQSDVLINGNVSIHGSVHLLGNDPNASVVSALDMSGTSFIHNTYGQIGGNNGGISADLAARIGYTGDPSTSHPSFSYTDFDGDGTAGEFTLNANLRVKNGTIELGGNSEIGTDSGGANEKLTMDGVYFGDGGGDEVLSGAENIFSDNGYETAYDLGDLVEFPTYEDDGGEVFITEEYLEGFNAPEWTKPDGTVEPNPGHDPVGDRVFSGDITLQAGPAGKTAGNNFFWNASNTDPTTMPNTGVVGEAAGTGNMPTEADLAALIANGDNFIWYDSTANPPKMVINGRIPVDGNLSFTSGTGQNDTIEYEGKGTVAAVDLTNAGNKGDLNVDANLLTTDYPHNNLLGLMSQNDMHVGDSSQLDLMGGFYAQGTVYANFQSNVVGGMVANYFDLGSNVPNIYWVPGLPDAWTDQQRMIGSDPINKPVKIGWREYNVRLDNPVN